MNAQSERNLHDRPLAEIKPGDTIYAMRQRNGYSLTYHGTIVRFDKGTVVVLAKCIDPQWGVSRNQAPAEHRFRVDKCFLWGSREPGHPPRCHWFSKGKNHQAV